MTSRLAVADVAGYLANTGWQERPERWRDAAIWFDSGDHVVLVPATDDFGDRELWTRQVLDVLTAVECRPRDEVVWDINSALSDVQSYVTFPDEQCAGETTLADGPDVLRCVHDLVDVTARAVVVDDTEGQVDRLLGRIRLRPASGGGYGVMIGIPADHPLGGRICDRLRNSITTLADVAGRHRSDVPDDGISADLCRALSGLAGPDGQWPFRITFRPAGRRSSDRSRTIEFPAGAGEAIRVVADRLRHRTCQDEPPTRISGTLPLLSTTDRHPSLEDTGCLTTN